MVLVQSNVRFGGLAKSLGIRVYHDKSTVYVNLRPDTSTAEFEN
jgi:hypothetical protein